MPLPVRLPQYHPLQKGLAAGVIALLCAGFGMLLWSPVRVLGVVRTLDDVVYDSLYRLRPPTRVAGGPIVIVAVDDESLNAMDAARKVGWPWPRKYWGEMISYLDAVGAKVVVIDIIMDRTSVYNAPAKSDDQSFAEAVDAAGTPTVLATIARPDGTVWNIAPPVTNKIVGAANVSGDDIIRAYAPVVNGKPSLALQAMKQLKAPVPAWAGGNAPFLLRYYGPHAKAGKPYTFSYISAAHLLAAAEDPDQGAKVGITPEMFKGKIVLIAPITAGTYDLKASPLSPRYPGVEVHATALRNMLTNEHVVTMGAGTRVLILILACLAAAVGTVAPARVIFKFIGGISGIAIVLGTTAWLFMGSEIRWMPPAGAALAAVGTAFVGLTWSYFTETRQRRFVLKALSQYVSKSVAEQLTRDPRKLSLSGERREMTVMFTDLENFTTLSESVDGHRLADMLNFYFQEMSGVILGRDGTLDKYIGDSIMSFWNAPLDQSDHARRACHAAIEMLRRENALAEELRKLADAPVRSRIGINSGPMIVGNMGSSHKFDYTVLGDSVNLASRLEGANKLYGTRVLLSENTAHLVKDHFVVRKVDLLRVKGKLKPMGAYELMGEGGPDEKTARLIERYGKALSLYQSRDFNAAWELLIGLAGDFPEDGPTATLLGRVLRYREHPPGEDWDGVYVATEK